MSGPARIPKTTTTQPVSWPDLVGNAARHAFKYHAGTCAYIVSDDGDLIIYEGVRVFVFSSMFTNKYGQSFDADLKSFSYFERYMLNKDRLSEVHNRFISHQIIYEIAESNNRHDLHYIDHYF